MTWSSINNEELNMVSTNGINLNAPKNYKTLSVLTRENITVIDVSRGYDQLSERMKYTWSESINKKALYEDDIFLPTGNLLGFYICCHLGEYLYVLTNIPLLVTLMIECNRISVTTNKFENMNLISQESIDNLFKIN